jgi:glyoxylase-like metal-dependent hydrolase (beta-lactamase superfamily II)
MKQSPVMTFLAMLAALALPPAALAQAPGVPAPPPPAAEHAPFETAQTDASSWAGRFGSTNCAWFDLGDGVLLLDTGAMSEDAKNLLAEVKRTVPGKAVKWVVMTHLHPDSNNGFAAMLPTDATLFVNRRAVENVRGIVQGAKGKAPTVVAVADTVVLVAKTQTLEIHATAAPAHTEHDLWVYVPASGIVYVGDLVTPTRCPMTSDRGTDPKGWLATLDKIEALHPQGLIPTRGPFSQAPATDIKLTRDYLNRMLEILKEMKAKGAAEARVSGELFAKKIGDYCPQELDAINGLGLYRRMTPDGKFPPAKAAKADAPAPKK